MLKCIDLTLKYDLKIINGKTLNLLYLFSLYQNIWRLSVNFVKILIKLNILNIKSKMKFSN